jgi:hypothetical protein
MATRGSTTPRVASSRAHLRSRTGTTSMPSSSGSPSTRRGAVSSGASRSSATASSCGSGGTTRPPSTSSSATSSSTSKVTDRSPSSPACCRARGASSGQLVPRRTRRHGGIRALMWQRRVSRPSWRPLSPWLTCGFVPRKLVELGGIEPPSDERLPTALRPFPTLQLRRPLHWRVSWACAHRLVFPRGQWSFPPSAVFPAVTPRFCCRAAGSRPRVPSPVPVFHDYLIRIRRPWRSRCWRFCWCPVLRV